MAPAVASGHAAFQDASPEPGSTVRTAPSTIVLAFTEPLNRRLSHVEVIDRAGRDAAKGPTIAVTGDDNAMQRKLVD